MRQGWDINLLVDQTPINIQDRETIQSSYTGSPADVLTVCAHSSESSLGAQTFYKSWTKSVQCTILGQRPGHSELGALFSIL